MKDRNYKPIPITLSAHPKICPTPIPRAKFNCGVMLDNDIRRSGYPPGEGRYYQFCKKCGFVYYDLEVEK